MVRRWTVGVLACLAAVPLSLAAGCSEKHQAAQTLPTTASRSIASNVLGPLGPADRPMPREARTRDAAGAEAFTRYYLSLINRTAEVSNTTALRDLSEGCETCNRIAADSEKDAAAGYQYRGGSVSIVSAAPVSVKGDTFDFAFLADQQELVVVDRAGKPVPGLTLQPLHNVSSGSTARWDKDRHTWLMTQLTFG